ncbi:MAG TPA: glycogen debranching protein GlgX [Dyella sp.]|uniref:glycogen debranching protein GlgX n=1 Tax=Dyella sp. TaxID=1869338 RepID=UPI002C8F90E9|nr:glycogen debranching protein GlgX [Dyella sp.]HUB90655.1 glycogen debranching protein GlgX [Dyella sp.]
MTIQSALAQGSPQPLGAHWDGHGVNMAVHSRHAVRVEWCLFDEAGTQETARLALPAQSGDVWHGYLEGAGPGLMYGLRAYGPYMPRHGHRFNPRKLLIDPYARALHGDFTWNDAVLGYATSDPHDPATPDTRDSAPYVPKCLVAASLPPLAQRPPRPHTAWRDSVLYEMHVKGFSMRHPDVPADMRGTFAALAEPALIAYWRDLGITGLELLPTAAFLDEKRLVQHGLSNYWGYNPIAMQAIHGAYLASGDALEMVRTVDRLHQAGLEIILDVVFNHTAETDAFGPTLSLRGLDNASYYLLQPDHPESYVDYSGCGNTLNPAEPAVAALIHAALRYWACEIGVDGFRFDLATALARHANGAFDRQSLLWRTIQEDPDLRQLKWIAEPWDASPHGHALGEFPPPFREWNDRYRDGVRRYWRGDPGMRGELATRFAGSSDVFANRARPPSSGINFITAHDGFTLADLSAYANKHNEPNGDANRDGTHTNLSRNFGVEGDTSDAIVLARRRRQRISMLGTLLLSRGVPMLLGGDELSHTQQGNNNAYCQDNETSWLDWAARGDAWRDVRDALRQAVKLRRVLPFVGEDGFYAGAPDPRGDQDIRWLAPAGGDIPAGAWHDGECGLAILLTDVRSEDVERERLFIALNGGDESLAFQLPAFEAADGWMVVLDSDLPAQDVAPRIHDAGQSVMVPAGGLVALAPRRSRLLGVSAELAAQASAAGIASDYVDADGKRHQVPAESLRKLIAGSLPGLQHAGSQASLARNALPHSQEHAPPCFLPPSLATPPGRWALSVQMYSLRSGDNWGIGDFEDLALLAGIVAKWGADGIQLSPLHALSLDRPQCASPYSPDSRSMLNPLFISVAQAAGGDAPAEYRAFMDRADTRAELQRLRSAALVDYPAVVALKRHALALLYDAFRDRHLGPEPSAEGMAFLRFCGNEGQLLHRYCVFQALRHDIDRRSGRQVAWQAWPPSLRDPASPEVDAFAREHSVDVAWHAYLQWLARRQWRHAAACARAAGMQLGWMTDLALGAALDSAESWQWPGLAALDVELGAPPDAFASRGQCWGIPPWRPQQLIELDYAPFDAVLEATMRHAGAMRLDHVMGLMRQFWVPRGDDAAHGAYMAYPFETLLQHVAQASMQNRCAIIGEDLGVVPPGMRERMQEACMLGYRVVYFERGANGEFMPPGHYAPLSMAVVSTHDLPTVTGLVEGLDIQERHARNLYASNLQAEMARAERHRMLMMLAPALAPYTQDKETPPDAESLHRFLAACTSRLAVVQIEDMLDMRRQANLPGMADEAPNWRQRLPLAVEALEHDPRMNATAAIFRGRARH